MICRKCNLDVADGPFCCQCGAKQAVPARRPKSRGNGQGSVVHLANGKYKAVKVLGWYLDDNGKKHRKTATATFAKKKDAVACLPTLGMDKTAAGRAEKKARTTLQELYKLWFPTHRAGKSTLGNYQAAFKYFKPLYHELAADVDLDDLQECIDECPRGKSTRRNMRTVIGLIFKYGIPRDYFPNRLNLADYLMISGETGVGGVGLPSEYLEKIKNAIDTVPNADMVYCHCYLGFRPSELLALDVKDYNATERAFVGGAKTEAGKDRTVTISPKIQPIIDRRIGKRKAGPVFCGPDGKGIGLKEYRANFYCVLEDLGLQNPTFDVNGQNKHTYTPHSCRHTFATLMKRVPGSDKDKLGLIGHASDEQLRDYQDIEFGDLRKITDAI